MSQTNNFQNDNVKDLTARIFSKLLYKTNFSNKKGNLQLLGIDLLKSEVQKDLVSITALRVEEIYMKILEKSNPNEFMKAKGKVLFLQCIKNSCEDFLTKKYGYKVKVNLEILKKSLYTKALLQDMEVIFQVPFYVLLDPQSPIFRLVYYPVYNFASESFIARYGSNIPSSVLCFTRSSIANFPFGILSCL